MPELREAILKVPVVRRPALLFYQPVQRARIEQVEIIEGDESSEPPLGQRQILIEGSVISARLVGPLLHALMMRLFLYTVNDTYPQHLAQLGKTGQLRMHPCYAFHLRFLRSVLA